MCNVRKIASLYLSNTPTITLDYIKTFLSLAVSRSRITDCGAHQIKANTLIYTRWQHLMDTIHQSGMGRGGSTLPPDQLSRISPTHTVYTNLYFKLCIITHLKALFQATKCALGLISANGSAAARMYAGTVAYRHCSRSISVRYR